MLNQKKQFLILLATLIFGRFSYGQGAVSLSIGRRVIATLTDKNAIGMALFR
jgi:hypothetical protein